jgi:hypothetical protein
VTQAQQRVRIDPPFVGQRLVPLAHLLITATSSGTAQTFHTVPAGKMFRLGQLAVCNVTGSAATLSLHAIPNAGTIGNGNLELAAMSIAANTAVSLTDLCGGLYTAGMVLKAYSGTGSALVLHGWGDEIA